VLLLDRAVLLPPPGAPGRRVSGPALAAAAVEAPAAPEPQGEAAGRIRRRLGQVLGGVAVAGVVTALAAGAGVLWEKDRMSSHCDASGCDPEGMAAARRGSLYSTIGTVAGAVGIGSAAGWVYIRVMTPPGRHDGALAAVGGSF
jgi:hypothetical protein